MPSTTELTAADGHKLSAYRTDPDGAANGLVVIQEIFGVNRHMREVCEGFAAEGYAVVAPALFDRVERGVELGYGPEDIACGRDMRTKVPEPGIIADIE